MSRLKPLPFGYGASNINGTDMWPRKSPRPRRPGTALQRLLRSWRVWRGLRALETAYNLAVDLGDARTAWDIRRQMRTYGKPDELRLENECPPGMGITVSYDWSRPMVLKSPEYWK